MSEKTRRTTFLRRLAAGQVRLHFVDEKPTDRNHDRVLCFRAGETKFTPLAEGQKPRDKWQGWTTNPAKVTCRRCLEWMHE